MYNFSAIAARAEALRTNTAGIDTAVQSANAAATAVQDDLTTMRAEVDAEGTRIRGSIRVSNIYDIVVSDTEPPAADYDILWARTENAATSKAVYQVYRRLYGTWYADSQVYPACETEDGGYRFYNSRAGALDNTGDEKRVVEWRWVQAAKWLPITYPTKAMTKNDMSTDTDFPAVANQSSAYGTAYAWMAFNNVTTSAWVSANAVASKPTEAAPQWISLKMPKPLRNITLHMWARGSTPSNPKTGFIQLSNDGETWVDSVPFSNSLAGASVEITDAANGLQCGNSTAYQYIKINVTSVVGAYNFTSLSRVTISGEYKEATT